MKTRIREKVVLTILGVSLLAFTGFGLVSYLLARADVNALSKAKRLSLAKEYVYQVEARFDALLEDVYGYYNPEKAPQDLYADLVKAHYPVQRVVIGSPKGSGLDHDRQVISYVNNKGFHAIIMQNQAHYLETSPTWLLVMAPWFNEEGHKIGFVEVKLDKSWLEEVLQESTWSDKVSLNLENLSTSQQEGESSEEIALFVPLNKYKDFGLRVSFPREEETLPVGELAKYLLPIAFVILIVAAGLAMQIAGRITAPIEELTKAAKALRRGRMDLQVRVSSEDELGDLARAFNLMTATISSYTHNLENMVQSRTKEMNVLNVALMEKNNELQDKNQQLHRLATRDMLTGVLNRHEFYKQGEEALRKGQHFGLLFIDLDNFKYYNDAFGHHIGDQLLIRVAKTFMDLLPEDALLGRYGGDEFVVLVALHDAYGAKALAHKLLNALLGENGYQDMLGKALKEPVQIPREKHLACSIGIALGKDVDLEQLMSQADEGMYEGKKAGKAQVILVT